MELVMAGEAIGGIIADILAVVELPSAEGVSFSRGEAAATMQHYARVGMAIGACIGVVFMFWSCARDKDVDMRSTIILAIIYSLCGAASGGFIGGVIYPIILSGGWKH